MPKRRTPREVATLITGFLEGMDDRAWDDLESVSIEDPFLESIRQRAIAMSPPNADAMGLRGLLAELKSRHPEVSLGWNSPEIIQRKVRLWPIIWAWNIGALVGFLALPSEWKMTAAFVAFIGMFGHVIYVLWRAKYRG